MSANPASQLSSSWIQPFSVPYSAFRDRAPKLCHPGARLSMECVGYPGLAGAHGSVFVRAISLSKATEQNGQYRRSRPEGKQDDTPPRTIPTLRKQLGHRMPRQRNPNAETTKSKHRTIKSPESKRPPTKKKMNPMSVARFTHRICLRSSARMVMNVRV